ncbi:hypothetical protein BgiMline_000905 [Biomphalaria glabrata]|nr:CAunnamed protein product [Biomphalaria glabrata]
MSSSSVDRELSVSMDIIKLQEKLLQNSLAVAVSIESLDSQDDSIAMGISQGEKKSCQDKRIHFYSNVTQNLSELDKVLNCDKNKRTRIILVVDRSGSMSGNPFSQVKSALTEIVSQCLNNPNQIAEIILYAETAETVSFTAENFKEAISNLTAFGSTSFKAAFDAVDVLLNKTKCEAYDSTVILFMTDGVDTISHQSKANEYAKKWSKSLKAFSHPITVHAVGFSKDHDLQFLTKIANAGSSQGLYRYCEPGDGPEALRDKLEELFDYVSVSDGLPIKFIVHLENPQDHLLCVDHQSEFIDGVIKQTENNGYFEYHASGDCWVNCDSSSNDLKLSLSIELVLKKNKCKYTIQIPCCIVDIKHIVHKDVGPVAVWNLNVMSRDIDILTTHLVDVITDRKDVFKLNERLNYFQNKMSKIEVFKPGYDKETRAMIMSKLKDIQGKLNKLHGMVAQYLRGETQGVSLLARVQDLRYEAQFSKVRRQRMMDRRVAKNFNIIKSDATNCSTVSEEQLKELSAEALGFYFCILSMCDVKDILIDNSSMDNALGLGLAVTRPEHVVDNPTSIRIHSISGSLVSRTSVMDALEFKINLDSHLSAHGGFSFMASDGSDLPHATVGSGREPINAWLPLYICPAHWERVKSCLRPSLGYLCTLDPMGYSDNQLDIIFMALGCMICKILESRSGENQLKIIYALQKTCQACMTEYNLTSQIIDTVNNFLLSPMGRFRHAVPSLQTLIGYLVSLPVATTRDLLGYTEVDEFSSLSKLWVAFLSEVLRRASGSSPELHANENVILSLLNLIINGDQDQKAGVIELKASEIPTCVYVSSLCHQLDSEEMDGTKLDIPEYDASAGMTTPDVQVHRSPKVDKAMALWAQAQCGYIKAKQSNEKLKEAKKIVRQWVTLVRQKIGLPVGQEEKDESSETKAVTEIVDMDTKTVNTSILEVVAKLLCHLTSKCFPSLESIISGFGFLHCWLKQEPTETDGPDCLPSEQWIQEIKAFMELTIKKLKVFEEQHSKVKEQVEELIAVVRASQKIINHLAEQESEGAVNNNVEVQEEEETAIQPEAEREQLREQTVAQEEQQVLTVKDTEAGEHKNNNPKSRNNQLITVPMFLSALNASGDHIELIRAMLCQAVSAPSNSQARDAVDSGEFLDLSQPGNAHNYLSNFKKDFDKRKKAAAKKMAEKAAWEIGNICMLRAETLWSFVGYLLKTHKERGEGFSALINFILECPGVEGFPLLAEKVLILLLGKYQGCVVFARGNAWTPDKKLSARLEKVLGEETWRHIETELLSNVHIHVYRESDIPNRHGHCNSNPYIPNRIRQILGMPLIEENKQTLKKRNATQKK